MSAPGRAVSARLVLMRHGQTPSNVAGALDTALPGAPLTPLGREQAAIAGDELAASGVAPALVLGSEAARAQETAGIVAGRLGLATGVAPDAFEVQAGDFEMRDDPEAILAYDRVLRDWLERGDTGSRLPGGESALDVRDRVMPLVEELRRDALDSGTDALLVIHGTLMRMIAVFCGAVPSQWALGNRIPNCGRITLVPDGGGWRCLDWAGGGPPEL